jgi:ABC-type antimicrobial peptide transport system permease subunit
MGANKYFIIGNLLTDSLKYVLLANFIAFPFAYFILSGMTGVFESFFGYKYEITPTLDSIYGAFIIGILVPIISAISPIWDVIKYDLV